MQIPQRSRLTRTIIGAGVAFGSLILMSPLASAHLTPTEPEGPAGGVFTTEFQLGHGCDDDPTTKVEIKIPDGVTQVEPKAIDGWKVSTTKRPVDPPIEVDGKQVSETVDTVTWEGGSLPSGEPEQFGMTMRLPDGKAGDKLYFPFIQSCGTKTVEWLGIQKDGEPEPEFPAGMITLAGVSGGSGSGPASTATDHSEHDMSTTTVAGGEVATRTTNTSGHDSGSDSNALSIVAIVLSLVGIGIGAAAFAKATQSSKPTQPSE